MAARRVLDQVSTVARLKHFSIRTEKAYRQHIKRFILFHGKWHPTELVADEVSQFLTPLADNLVPKTD